MAGVRAGEPVRGVAPELTLDTDPALAAISDLKPMTRYVLIVHRPETAKNSRVREALRARAEHPSFNATFHEILANNTRWGNEFRTGKHKEVIPYLIEAMITLIIKNPKDHLVLVGDFNAALSGINAGTLTAISKYLVTKGYLINPAEYILDGSGGGPIPESMAVNKNIVITLHNGDNLEIEPEDPPPYEGSSERAESRRKFNRLVSPSPRPPDSSPTSGQTRRYRRVASGKTEVSPSHQRFFMADTRSSDEMKRSDSSSSMLSSLADPMKIVASMDESPSVRLTALKKGEKLSAFTPLSPPAVVPADLGSPLSVSAMLMSPVDSVKSPSFACRISPQSLFSPSAESSSESGLFKFPFFPDLSPVNMLPSLKGELVCVDLPIKIWKFL